jgi:hypothetical protein
MVRLQCVAHGMVVNCTEFQTFTFDAPISECISNVHTFMCKCILHIRTPGPTLVMWHSMAVFNWEWESADLFCFSLLTWLQLMLSGVLTTKTSNELVLHQFTLNDLGDMSQFLIRPCSDMPSCSRSLPSTARQACTAFVHAALCMFHATLKHQWDI